ncbi:MAG: K(+)-transporting ATPase subunit F [Antricoccus sp.]
MNAEDIVGLVLVAALTIYLVLALIHAEKM